MRAFVTNERLIGKGHTAALYTDNPLLLAEGRGWLPVHGRDAPWLARGRIRGHPGVQFAAALCRVSKAFFFKKLFKTPFGSIFFPWRIFGLSRPFFSIRPSGLCIRVSLWIARSQEVSNHHRSGPKGMQAHARCSSTTRRRTDQGCRATLTPATLSMQGRPKKAKKRGAPAGGDSTAAPVAVAEKKMAIKGKGLDVPAPPPVPLPETNSGDGVEAEEVDSDSSAPGNGAQPGEDTMRAWYMQQGEEDEERTRLWREFEEEEDDDGLFSLFSSTVTPGTQDR